MKKICNSPLLPKFQLNMLENIIIQYFTLPALIIFQFKKKL